MISGEASLDIEIDENEGRAEEAGDDEDDDDSGGTEVVAGRKGGKGKCAGSNPPCVCAGTIGVIPSPSPRWW